jgi:hypothetical protein
MAWTEEDSHKLADLLKAAIIPYVSTSFTSLGGEDQASIFIRISRQDKKDWPGGIFHNSDYVIFSLHSDNKLSNVSKHNMPKFRKATVKSIEDVANRIIKYFKV